jgi:hypothetical protein
MTVKKALSEKQMTEIIRQKADIEGSVVQVKDSAFKECLVGTGLSEKDFMAVDTTREKYLKASARALGEIIPEMEEGADVTMEMHMGGNTSATHHCNYQDGEYVMSSQITTSFDKALLDDCNALIKKAAKSA